MNKEVQDLISKDSIFKVGKVISVEGRTVKVEIDKNKNTSHILYRGSPLKNISVGGYLKIVKGFIKIIGKVEGEYIEEPKLYERKDYKSKKEKINRILSLKMLGFFEGDEFKRGIKELPLIDNECFLVDSEEFDQIHNFIRSDDEPITIGKLSLEKGQHIKVGVNSLFASHIGVFGNTGSGKSYTLAKIYREFLKIYKDEDKFKEKASFLLLDFNGEYIENKRGKGVIIEENYKRCYDLSTGISGRDKFPIPIKGIMDPNFWIVFLTATEKTQSPFIKRVLKKNPVEPKDIKNLIKNIITNEDRGIDKGTIFNFLESISIFLEKGKKINIGNLRNHLKWHGYQGTFYIKDVSDNKNIYANDDSEKVMSLIKKYLKDENYDFKLKDGLSKLQEIQFKMTFYHYDEITRGFSNPEHIAPLIKRFEKRVDDLEKIIEVKENEGNETNKGNNTKNFTIVSLKDVNVEMKKILPLLICKQIYEKKRRENKKNEYLNLIIDEAHNILSSDSERESEHWRDYRLETFEEMIKEGRKFGVFLTIASQRPSDISSTIISQIHNYFLHRLINEKDILAIRNTISYLDKVSFDYLPILPTGTVILAGLLAQVPVVIDIQKIEEGYEPNNETINLTNNWTAK